MILIFTWIILYFHINGNDCMACDDVSWQEHMGTCYLRYNSDLQWESAWLTCTNTPNKYQLVVIDNTALNTFIYQNITNSADVWIGLKTSNVKNVEDWTWSDGQSVSYIEDLNTANVNSFCMIMNLSVTDDATTPYWHTQQCSFISGFICEKDMVNNACPNTSDTWLEFDNHCYLEVTEETLRKNSMAAARYCWKQGAYLVSINNQSEATFLYSAIQHTFEYWIGLSPLKWHDGTPFQYNNWDDSGPEFNVNDICIYMNSTSGKWSSDTCRGSRRFVCQNEASIDTRTPIGQTSNSHAELETTSSIRFFEDSNTKSPGLSKQLILMAIVPAVVGGILIIIVIVVVVVFIQRRKRAPSQKTEIHEWTVECHDNQNVVPDLYDTVEITELNKKVTNSKPSTNAHGQEAIIYDTTEIVQGPASTVVVNGDVYAIVDKDKPGNNKKKDNAIHGKTKDTFSKEQSRIVVGTDVYAIVDKKNVKPNKQNRPKQNKKKPAPPPKLEDELDEINSIGQNHIVVGSDVYAIVDKDKATPNNQKKPMQKKKKTETSPKLEDRSDEITPNGENHIVVGSDVYAIVDQDKVTLNNQNKTKQKKKKPETPPKLEDHSDKITPNGENHIVVGSDVYAIVDKDKVILNNQKKPKQTKKKPETPPKLEDIKDKIDEGNVYYNEFNLKAPPIAPTEHNRKKKKQTENTGVVYADIDLTGPVSGHNQDSSNDEESGVVYADVRG